MTLIWTLHYDDSHAGAVRHPKASAVWCINAPDVSSFRWMQAIDAPMPSALNCFDDGLQASRLSATCSWGDIPTEPQQENRPTLFDRNLARPMTCDDSGHEDAQNTRIAPQPGHRCLLRMSNAV
ncbi:hypothetical protein G3480_13110 [Thiorhodococcus mannitoliphagus]|uniref:Uncharacterized protein n=1 Tax=Thiorhodococcus mannitoliphagus TaxID=329406 RepID=A0A6P1DYK6_9GAMM|nr:hypothetical protein [Thiorhodococcus mannitoliphagus]NEX21242.1 hypothetical protein [Thiorhodococcus mannitoliphagus]